MNNQHLHNYSFDMGLIKCCKSWCVWMKDNCNVSQDRYNLTDTITNLQLGSLIVQISDKKNTHSPPLYVQRSDF